MDAVRGALAGVGLPNAEEISRWLWPQAWRIVAALGVLLAFQIGGRLLAGGVRRVRGRQGDPGRQDLLELGAQVVTISALVLGIVMALGTCGFNVAPLVAGLGLSGFALGFALRDALSNMLAGALVLFYRPFQRGDLISVDGKDGTVMQIDLRYTTLQGEGRRILIPNSNLFTTAIQVIEKPEKMKVEG